MSHKNPKHNPQRANSGNPNNDAYWQSRGYDKRPDNWRELLGDTPRETSSKNRQSKRYWAEHDAAVAALGPLSKDDYQSAALHNNRQLKIATLSCAAIDA